MYYPKSQVIPNQYSRGELIIASTGETYIGDYWSTSNGKFFSGKSPESLPYPIELQLSSLEVENNTANSLDLEPQTYNVTYQTIKYLQLKGIKSKEAPGLPKYSSPILTNKDYKNGEITRFFCKKINEGLFLEINQKTYNKLKTKDKSIAHYLYTPFILFWVITGEKEQVALENKHTVEYKEFQEGIHGLSSYLKNDYLEFYSLYTDGGEYTTSNGESYKGLYHIHPLEGPMVGPEHIATYHSKLFPL